MCPRDLLCLTQSDLSKFFASFDAIFCDCDGVILINQVILAGVAVAINALKSIKKKVMFITNNTSISRRDMYDMFARASIQIDDENDIINPAIAIGSYLQQIEFKKKTFVIGLPGLRNDLKMHGIQIVNQDYDTLEEYTVECLQTKLNAINPDVGAVIICLDFNMTLLSLNQALNYLHDPDILFIITGTDKTICWSSSSPNPQICLGAGYVQDIAKDVLKRKPLGFGKPLEGLEAYLKNVIKEMGLQTSRILFIGDSLEQDVSFAKRLGMQQLLVLTGNTALEDLNGCDGDRLPDYYVAGMSQLTTLINRL